MRTRSGCGRKPSLSPYSITPATPAGTGTGPGIRGGSWHDLAGICSVAVRSDSYPENRYDNVGFRLALSAVP